MVLFRIIFLEMVISAFTFQHCFFSQFYQAWKRLQASEENRIKSETEANRYKEEVNLLKSQVLNLRTEFATHREDLVKKLAETKFDAQMVQDLHMEM